MTICFISIRKIFLQFSTNVVNPQIFKHEYLIVATSLVTYPFFMIYIPFSICKIIMIPSCSVEEARAYENVHLNKFESSWQKIVKRFTLSNFTFIYSKMRLPHFLPPLRRISQTCTKKRLKVEVFQKYMKFDRLVMEVIFLDIYANLV